MAAKSSNKTWFGSQHQHGASQLSVTGRSGVEAGEMAQGFTALLNILSSIPINHMTAHNYLMCFLV